MKYPLNAKEDFKKAKIAPDASRIQQAAENMVNNMLSQFDKGNLAKKTEVQLNPVFEIEISELSGLMTHIAFNPNREVIEDRYKLSTYKTKQL